MKAKPSKHPGEVVLELNRRDEPLMAAASISPSVHTFQIKKILVPIDFSACATKALQYAIPLAKEHKAAITLLYVAYVPSFVSSEPTGIDYPAMRAGLLVQGENQLAALAVDQVRGAVPVDTLARAGSPADEIIEAARTLPVDMIVLSTHGRTGLKHVFMGSVAENVVRRAPCPVLVLKQGERECLAAPQVPAETMECA